MLSIACFLLTIPNFRKNYVDFFNKIPKITFMPNI